jgi:hypothetical protein
MVEVWTTSLHNKFIPRFFFSIFIFLKIKASNFHKIGLNYGRLFMNNSDKILVAHIAYLVCAK